MRFFTGLITILAVLLVGAGFAEARNITVSTKVDDYMQGASTCSLREAITAAQTNKSVSGCLAGSGADTILLPSGRYELSRANLPNNQYEWDNELGDLNVTGSDELTIAPQDSAAKVTIDANQIDRVMSFLGTGSLTVKNLNLTGGKTASQITGGGFFATTNSGPLLLSGVSIFANSAGDLGGGLAFFSSPSKRSVVNSSIFANRANGNGGGIYVMGGSDVSIRSTTIVGNIADADKNEVGDGGGVAFGNGSGTISMVNSLLATNDDYSSKAINQGPDCASGTNFYPRYVVSTQTLGYLLCRVGAVSDTNVLTTTPKFGWPTDEGSQTVTVPLLEGSPAIDAGGKTGTDVCPLFDQRGTLRPAGKCDVGAFEVPLLNKVGTVLLPPEVSSLDPGPSGSTLTPKVKGQATPGTTVRLYTDPACQYEPVASGSAEEFNSNGISVRVGASSTTTFFANVSNNVNTSSACSKSSVTYVNLPEAEIRVLDPTESIAVLDGTTLHVLLKCPARFKPRCVSRAVPVTSAGFKKVRRAGRKVRLPKGRPMARVQKVSIRSSKWLAVSFAIKPKFQKAVAAMVNSEVRHLVVRQQIRSKLIGKKKNSRTSVVFRKYKVRSQV